SGIAPRFLMVVAAAISVASDRLERSGMRMMCICICCSRLRAVEEVNTWSLLLNKPRLVPKRSGETGVLLCLPLVALALGAEVRLFVDVPEPEARMTQSAIPSR